MPELPEVETIKRELEKAILGKSIDSVCVNHPRVIRYPEVKEFKKELEGLAIKNVLRKAKVLILELSNGSSLVIHLKMTGQLVYPGKGKDSRVTFNFSDGSSLDFNDRRLFGELRLMDDWHDLKFIKALGPEPFDIPFEQFSKMLASKRTKIKPLLMDQGFISGIGNLYAAEVLFRAKISPEAQASSLTEKEKKLLFNETKETLKEAIQHKGSSIDQYVQLSGKSGGYARFHKVYGREGLPCPVCKTIIQRIALCGRGTYFCPKCQKSRVPAIGGSAFGGKKEE